MKYLPTILVCVLVLILSVINVGVLPKTDVPSADKIVHIVMYFGITIMLLLNQTRYLRTSISRGQLWFALLFPVAYGTLIELIQHFLPWRSGSVYDFIANTLGVVVAIGFFMIYKKYRNL